MQTTERPVMIEHTNEHSANGMALASDELARSLSSEADYVPHKFVQVLRPHLTRAVTHAYRHSLDAGECKIM